MLHHRLNEFWYDCSVHSVRILARPEDIEVSKTDGFNPMKRRENRGLDFIGDIHGYGSVLKELLNRLGYINNNDLYDFGDDDVSDWYDQMLKDFGIKGTPSRRTLSKINKILQEEEIGFFVYGTLSLGQKEIDQSTGNNITKASISGTVFDLTGKRAKRISSIAPQVVSGLGTTQDESRRLAIANSAKQSADILINVLNKRGIN